MELMMKCDMCYDRTSVGLRPMCATVCPSQALMYVTPEEAARLRRDTPVNTFRFGAQEVKTKVFLYLPQGKEILDVDVGSEIWGPGNSV
jgi:Fe-S-cluster-containing dehydrogenase component